MNGFRVSLCTFLDGGSLDWTPASLVIGGSALDRRLTGGIEMVWIAEKVSCGAGSDSILLSSVPGNRAATWASKMEAVESEESIDRRECPDSLALLFEIDFAKAG